ncbi:hypothetical protein AB205_0143530 [Aquarana catesbeiana]|uniref:Uncharacterized protein n=1 Tax=Aquarana catesbeiana TaxID=8400 RepID=A0A2G9Q6R4_AQUCT|nr:hypothetical protein AB205_0143530 [Aquarana catesbeiana]
MVLNMPVYPKKGYFYCQTKKCYSKNMLVCSKTLF